MADFEPPSFSLGFDFDLDLDPPPAPATGTSSGNNPSNPARVSSAAGITASLIVDEDDDFETPPIERQSCGLQPAPTLKRLRRGPASSAERPKPKEEKKFVGDDDIEEFSSDDEQMPVAASKHHDFLCSSSKLPLSSQIPTPFLASQSARPLSETQKKNVWNPSASLHKEAHSISKPPLSSQVHRPFLASQSAKPLSETQKKSDWNPSASSHKDAHSNKLVFPESDVSPLRRFQLIESDSDEASPSKAPNEMASRVDLHKRDGISTFTQVGAAGEWKKTKAPGVTCQADDLWEGIPSEKDFHIRTPVLDEICEEHFRSVKDKNHPHKSGKGYNASTSSRENEVQQVASSDTTIPAHHYYHHEDFRIQQLVRARLPHFTPLSHGNNPGIKQNDASTINYMGQFNQRESSKQGRKNANAGSSSKKPRKNSRKSVAVDVQEESDDWITPKRPDEAAKDAGKKRVQGVCKPAGQWFTAADGKKVYVAGNGQESSGRAAYMRYKRESGGFKKSNKKATSKKKAGKKK